MLRCKYDVAYWFNHWAWTYDPRPRIKTMPFDLFPVQVDFLAWLAEREQLEENGLVEKSRDSGATYIACGYALHAWLYRDGFSAGFGSRKLELVDTIGDPDSIFEKVRIILRNLPSWMLPDGFSWREHSGECKLVHPRTGATITGEGGDNIGRGGRKSMYFVDEFAFVEHPDAIDAALSQNTNCRIDISTPNGNGNSFFKKRHSGNVAVYRFHWAEDPRKNGYQVLTQSGLVVATGNGKPARMPATAVLRYPWYEKEKKRIADPVIVAQEIDIDYAASVEGVCIPARWVSAAVNLLDSAQFKAAFPDYKPHGSVVCAMDVSANGKNKTIFGARRAIHVFLIKELTGNGTATAHSAIDEIEAVDGTVLHYDANGVGYAIQSAFESMERPIYATLNPVLGGAAPTETVWMNGKTSQELFRNRRSEIWHKLRARFEKTFEFMTEGTLHPPDEMISIPNCMPLISDLSTPLRFRTEAGKWQLESKEQMFKRGITSPDYGDMVAYSEEGEVVDWGDAADHIARSREDRFEVPEVL